MAADRKVGKPAPGAKVARAQAESTTQRCQRYRRELQLHAEILPDSRTRIVVQTDPISAVMMPSRLGAQCAELLAEGGPLGPVIEHPGSSRWTFLTDGHYPEGLSADMLRWNIGIASKYIVLPSPADEQRGFRRWIHEPRTGFRPSTREILRTVPRIGR